VAKVALPSVLLHDHLDGGLRPETVLDLAHKGGYEDLPGTDIDSVASFFDQSRSGSLESYLDAFRHTIGVMQDRESLERVAYEAAVDLTNDGVVYAEIRFCPLLHTQKGLSSLEVVMAVSAGMKRGAEETGLAWGLLIDAMRQETHSMEMAELAVATQDLGVVGFDLAGPELGNPPGSYLAACRLARTSGLRLTIHAGEAAGDRGPAYMAEAMDLCGAERLGHGVELAWDCVLSDGEVVEIGRVASRVLDRQIPLEMCPSSNLATSRLAPDQHPIGAFYRAGFNVTVNTDNRLMSATTMSAELDFVRRHHGFEVDDLARVTRGSLMAAFCDHATKRRLWEERIAPAYREEGATVGGFET
jgi:adenosine deaminase